MVVYSLSEDLDDLGGIRRSRIGAQARQTGERGVVLEGRDIKGYSRAL